MGWKIDNTDVAKNAGAVKASTAVAPSVRYSPEMENTFGQALAYGLPGIGVGFADTVGQSVGVFDDTTVENTLKQVTEPGGFGDFYARNKQPLRMGGEIAGMFIPGMVGVRALNGVRYLREVGTLGSFLKNSSSAEAILGSAASLKRAEDNVRLASREVADSMGIVSGRSFSSPALDMARRGYYGARLAETLRTTAAMEAGYRVLYNDSETFYPADYTLSDEIKWAGVGFAGSAAIDFAIGRYAVRGLIKAAGKTAAGFGATETAQQSDRILSRPGDRGIAVTYAARVLNEGEYAIKNSGTAAARTTTQQDMTTYENVLRKGVADMATDAHPLITRLNLDPKDARVDLVMGVLKKDDTAMLFTTKLGDVPPVKSEFYGAVDNEIKNTQKKMDKISLELAVMPTKTKFTVEDLTKAQTQIAELEQQKNEIHLVVENTGEITNFRQRSANWLDTNSFKSMERSTFVEKNLTGNMTKSPTGRAVPEREEIIHSKLTVGDLTLDDRFINQGKEPVNPDQWSILNAMGSRMVAEYKPFKGQEILLDPKMSRFQLDGFLELLTAKPELRATVKLSGEFNNLKDVEFHVVNEKFKEFDKLMARTERADPKLPRAMQASRLDPDDVRQMLNLPLNDRLQPTPLLQVFAQAKLQGAKDLSEIFKQTGLGQKDHPLDLLQASMREAVQAADPKMTFPIRGQAFKQKDVRPLLMVTKSIPQMATTDAAIHAMIENRQAIQMARLSEVDPAIAPMVASTATGIGGLASLPTAKNVRSLYESVVSGKGIFTAQDRINEQLPTLKAIALIAQEHDRQILQTVSNMFDEGLTPLVSKLRQKGNYNHLIDYNRIEQSYRHGWDVKAVEFSQDGKSARFRLDPDSPLNRKLYTKFFSEDTADYLFREGNKDPVYMPDMSQTAQKALRRDPIPLRVSELAAATAQEVSRLSRQSGVETNALRTALGRGSITLRDFHLPTPEFANENAWFVKNAHGDVVATFSKETIGQNQRRAEQAAAELKTIHGEDHFATGLDEIRRQHMYDENFQGMIDYSDQLAKSGAPITGGAASTQIDSTVHTLENTIKSLSRQYINIGLRARAAIFEPQLNFAKMAGQSLAKDVGDENNIFGRYIATLFSRSTQSPKGWIAGVYTHIESKMDAALSYLYSTKAEISAHTEAGRLGARQMRKLVKSETSEELYRQYQNSFGPKAGVSSWSPFESTQAWLESTHPEIPTKRTREFAVSLSQVSSTMALRFLDAGTAWLNLVGYMTTFPAVIKGMRALPGEAIEDTVARTGSWGSSVSFVPGARPFSATKAAMNAIHAMWTGELSEEIGQAVKNGVFTPEYEMIAKALSNPQYGDKSKFSNFVTLMSALADNSEILTRKLSWITGYKFGKDVLKFDDPKNLEIFATNFMNETIGNYSSRNKPGIFQGAIGLPMGAFQTYMFNYYRRIYGYVEKKQYASLAAAYGAQASMFGAQSVPGWTAFNSMLFSNYDGSDNLLTRLERKLPPGVAELVLHGSLSSIPAIFGRGDLDLALYPRGSVDITQIPANPLDYGRAPPIQFLAETAMGINAAYQNFMTVGGFSIQRAEEIGANFSTNRAIKNIMEMAAGAKTDRSGQYVADATFDALHIAAALSGSQVASTREVQDAYNRQQIVERQQAALRDELNVKTRSLLRANRALTTDDMQTLVRDYMRSGGNPAYFGQWLRNTVETSFVPKADKKLAELAGSAKWVEFTNLLAAMQQHAPATPTKDQ